MAVAGLLDYHGNPVRGRKGLIKIRANGASSAGSKQTLGKALSRGGDPPSSSNSSVEPAVNRPAGPLRRDTRPSPSLLATGTRLRLGAELLPIFIERSSFMAGRSSDRGVEREGDVFRRFHRDRFLEEEGRDLF